MFTASTSSISSGAGRLQRKVLDLAALLDIR
jgi:hypothetical protein